MNEPDTENFLRSLAEEWAQRKLDAEELVASSANAVRSSSASARTSAALLAEMRDTLDATRGPFEQLHAQPEPNRENVRQIDQPPDLPETAKQRQQ